MIEIYVASYNGRPPPAEIKVAFGPEGGTLGRGPDNRMVLPDPARHVSRLQARIRCEGERCFIANISEANPLFLNGVEIDPGGEGALASGDEVRIGLYVLGARPALPGGADACAAGAAPVSPAGVATSEAGANAHPAVAGDPLVALGGGSGGAGVDPFADLYGSAGGASSIRPPQSARASAAASSVAPVKPAPIDPFADLLQSRVSPAADSTRASKVRSPTDAVGPQAAAAVIPDDFNPFDIPSAARRNTEDPLRDLARPAADLGSVEAGMERDALLDFALAAKPDPRDRLQGGTPSLVDSSATDPLKLFAGENLLDRPAGSADDALPMPDKVPEIGAQFTPPRAIPEGTNKPRIKVEAPDLPSAGPARPPGVKGHRGEADEAETARRMPSPPGPAAPRGAPVSAHAASPRATGEEVAGAPVAVVAPAASSADSGALLRAFLRGARVEGLVVPAGLTPELMESIGALVYHATAGAMELIAARQITKREIRADVTVIVPRDNNPLKFLATPEAAIMQMLGPRMPGFTSTAQAMAEVFDDLRTHEIGVIAGMRAALAEALLRFDPAALEQRLGKAGMLDSLLPGARHAKLWRLLQSQFQALCHEARASFDEAFTKAYEEQVEQDRRRRGSR